MKRFCSFVLLLMVALAASAEEHPLDLAQRAASAYAGQRYAEAADLYVRVAAANPRSPGARLQAARSLARTGNPNEALEHLGAVVDFGLRFDPSDEAWSALDGDPRFQRLVSRMRAITAPLVRSTVAFRLEKDLIPENVAWDPATGAFFVGSMYKAKIIRIAPDGSVTDFVPSRRDGLLSVLGMKIDSVRRELWAVAGNFGDRPPMEAEDPASVGKGALFRFDLDGGTLIRAYPGGTPDLPLTGTIVGDELFYVARSQLRAFDGNRIWPLDRLKETTILRLPLEIAVAPAPDLEAERASLLEMHRGEIRAHLDLDAGWIAEGHGDEYRERFSGASTEPRSTRDAGCPRRRRRPTGSRSRASRSAERLRLADGCEVPRPPSSRPGHQGRTMPLDRAIARTEATWRLTGARRAGGGADFRTTPA